MSQKKKNTNDSTITMDDEVQYEERPSLTHLDRFQHQGSPTVDPNLTAEDIASLCFPISFSLRMPTLFKEEHTWNSKL